MPAASCPTLTGCPAPCRTHPLRPLVVTVLLAALTACGGGGGGHDDHDHGQTRIDTKGRLAIAEHEAAALHVYDLDEHKVEMRHTLAAPASSVYASPGKRYALAIQRTQNRVQLVDGGIFQEDHGDHAHDYRRGSTLLSWQLDGAKPTHYNALTNGQAALFMDGQADSTPPVNATTQVLTEQGISTGKPLAGVSLASPMHGLALPLDDLLLVSMRTKPATGNDVLPDRVQVFSRQGTSYQPVSILSTACERLHGGDSSGDYSVVGCNDGALLIKRDGSRFTETKLLTTPRIASAFSHQAHTGHLVGYGNTTTAPRTTTFFAINGAKGTATPIALEGWDAGTTRQTSAFDKSGRLLILNSKGTLYTLQFDNGSWKTIKRTDHFISLPDAAPWPSLTASGTQDEMYITNPKTRELWHFDSSSHAITRRDKLDFSPAAMTWVGITR
ncbi:MAG: hypothetical protein Q4D91_01135 [Lautropia sp.]|nr:hypothetical protein [Lautropia sp.]